ncbi:MAG: hypothetical protein DMG57_02245 [Acidobacteria bacterium]|nr:MAG: hypothetical protein DMG57_02245 [Acidobacteriota bacterium]
MDGLDTRKRFAAHSVNAVVLLESLRFALGLCEACAYPTFNRALANWMRRSERARASGLIHAATGFGGAFTPVWIALIIGRFRWWQSFFLSALLTFLVVVMWHWLATDEPAEHRRVSEHELAVIAGEKEERHAEKAEPGVVRTSSPLEKRLHAVCERVLLRRERLCLPYLVLHLF